MNIVKPCLVLIQPLTDEEIKLHTSCNNSEASLPYLEESEHLAMVSKHHLRDHQKHKLSLFENYKRSREEKKLKRLKRLAKMSKRHELANDEFEPFTISNSGKVKKRRGRMRKKLSYEDDLEWSPHESRNNYFPKRNFYVGHKMLRRTARRPILQSASSSSEDDFVPTSKYFPHQEYEKDHSESANSSSTTVQGSANEMEQVPHICESNEVPVSSENSAGAQNSTVATNSVFSSQCKENNSAESDVLSKIFKEMDAYDQENRRPASGIKNLCKSTDATVPGSLNEEFRLQKKRISHMASANVSAHDRSKHTVSNVVDDIVDTICSAETSVLNDVEMSQRKCVLCNSWFYSKGSETFCMICKFKTPEKNGPRLKAIASLKSAADKRQNKHTKDRIRKFKFSKNLDNMKKKILKNLPKHEKQRLMYTDKSSVEKGYNHCKSLITPKDNDTEISVHTVPSGTVTDVKEAEVVQKSSKKPVSHKKINQRPSESSTISSQHKSAVKRKKRKFSEVSESANNVVEVVTQPEVPLKHKRKEVVGSKEKVLVTNVDKGLFLMTFPEPDKELNLDMSIEAAPVQCTSSGSSRLLAKNISSTNVVENSKAKKLELPPRTSKQPVQSIAPSIPYETYYFPPLASVVVSNYTSTDSKNGHYLLSSVYYQNEATQKKVPSVETNNNSRYFENIGVPSNTISGGHLNNQTSASIVAPSQSHVTRFINSISNSCASGNVNYNSQTILPQVFNGVEQSSSVFPSTHQNSYLPPSDSSAMNFINALDISMSAVPENANLVGQPRVVVSDQVSSNCSVVSYLPEDTTDHLPIKISHVTSQQAETEESQQCDIGISNLSADDSSKKSEYVSNRDSNPKLSSQDVSSESEVPVTQVQPLDVQSMHKKANQDSPEASEESSKSPMDPQGDNNSEGSHSELNSSLDEQSQVENTLQHILQNSTDRAFNACQEIDAISILGVIDLERNPQMTLKMRVETARNDYAKVASGKIEDNDTKEKVCSLHTSLQSLLIAQCLLTKYGSFMRVSDHYLGKDKLIQIKKEKFLEEEEEEEERQSCQFSQKSTTPLGESEPTCNNEPRSMLAMKMENLSSCSLSQSNPDASSINHIEKIQTQISAINGHMSLNSQANLGLNSHINLGLNSQTNLGVNSQTNLGFNSQTNFALNSQTDLGLNSQTDLGLNPHTHLGFNSQTNLGFSSQTNLGLNSQTNLGLNSQTNLGLNSQTNLGLNSQTNLGLNSPIGASHHVSSASIAGLSAPTPVTPRNEYMTDARETPSRGSGPRTPARPESATSQPDESVLTPAQIKRERHEAANSPFSSQCAYSQNPALSQATNPVVSSHVTSPAVSSGLGSMMPNMTVTNNCIQSVAPLQNRDVPPNRTVPFNNGLNVSRVLTGLAKQQMAGNVVQNIPLIRQNGHLLNVHQVQLPRGAAGMYQRPIQPVPSSFNSNQLIIKQVPSANSAGGTVLVNSANMGGQNMYPVLTSVANQQVFTPNSVPQVYFTQTAQQVPCASNQVTSPTAFVTQNKQAAPENGDQMVCAVCKSAATLRCKQCAKVAYCNTACAKTYWHKKHKMECKSMTS